MAKQSPKPPAFVSGAKKMSANFLNLLRQAIPRVIRGGAGINVTAFGDRIVVSLAPEQGGPASPFALMTVHEEMNQYLLCLRDGHIDQPVLVAKPWGLRKYANWPSGPTYDYDDEVVGKRTAVLPQGEEGIQYPYGVTVEQLITPPYQVGEELLVARIPATRIPVAYLEEEDTPPFSKIVYIDINSAGRGWNLLPDHAHSGMGDGGALVDGATLAWNGDDEEISHLHWTKIPDETEMAPDHAWWEAL